MKFSKKNLEYGQLSTMQVLDLYKIIVSSCARLHYIFVS